MKLLKQKIFVALLFLCCSFSSCGQKTYKQKLKSLYRNTVPLVKSDELVKQLGGSVVLDTRSQKEFDVSHIQGAHLVDYDKPKLKTLDTLAKNQPIVVYCSVGYRSERIGEKLQKMGFTNVKNLYGGIFDWKNGGKEVLNSKNMPTDSVHTYNKKWSQWLKKGIKIYE